MFFRWLFSFFVLSTLGVVQGIEFHNKVDGSPKVECGQNEISILVETTVVEEPPSRIFAKGQSNKETCSFLNTKAATFSLSNCNMDRQRQLDPRGLYYSVTVVIQMHPLFITKVDRAYNIRCFYMEADKTVTAGFDVNTLATERIEEGHSMPQCMYGIHRDTPNGPIVRYAEIGDKVHHVWDCPSDVYGMLVHSCYVDDGQGNRIQILDDKGCGMDQYVMKTPVYSTDLTMVQQETHVFKFADRLAVKFQCQIKLCMTSEESCKGITPPSCPDNSGPGLERIISQSSTEATAGITQSKSLDEKQSTLAVPSVTPGPPPEPPTLTPTPQTSPPDLSTTISPSPIIPSSTQSTEGSSPGSAPPTETTVTGGDGTTTEAAKVLNAITPGSPGSSSLYEDLHKENLIDAQSTTVTAETEEVPSGLVTASLETIQAMTLLEGSGETDGVEGSGGAVHGSLEAFPTPYGFPTTISGHKDGAGDPVANIIRRAIFSASRDDPIRALLHEQDENFNRQNYELDIQSEMFVLEPDERHRLPDSLRNYEGPPQLEQGDSLLGEGGEWRRNGSVERSERKHAVCLSPLGFGLSVTAFVFMLITCLASCLYLCRRLQERRAKILPTRTLPSSRHSSFWDTVPHGSYKL